MTRIPVFFATTEGHTRRIAETIASVLREQGFQSEAVLVSDSETPYDWSTAVNAVVGASLHRGRHQPCAEKFVRREAQHLNKRPAAFFSVSLSAASRNPSEVAAAGHIATTFLRATEWQPHRVACFAGKLAYTQYGFVKRWFMRRIAEREGGPTDTSRDHDLTNWAAVREFALNVAADTWRVLQARAAS
jgi:menaquinone-dependent protoporphyrinogen oxidase